jgi:hypothetical protein
MIKTFMIKTFTLNKLGTYLLGAVLGLLAGALLYFVQPVKWRGQALIVVGEISSGRASIEPYEIVVKRLQSRAFIKGVAEKVKRDEINALLNVDEDAGMNIQPIRNTNSIDISILGGSEELVRAAIEGVIGEIVFKHNAQIEPYFVNTRKKLARLDSEIDVLSKRMALADVKQSVGKHKTVDGMLIMGMQSTLEGKIKLVWSLRDAMWARTLPTYALDPPSVSEWRRFSSIWRACLFGALSGIFLSAIWIRWGNRKGFKAVS